MAAPEIPISSTPAARESLSAHGLSAASYLYFIAKHFQTGLVLMPSSVDLSSAAETLSFFLREQEKEALVLSYPSFERIYDPVRQDPECLFRRLETQTKLLESKNQKVFVLTSKDALSQKTLSKSALEKSIVHLKKGEWAEREALAAKLEALGYRKDDLAQDEGFFSVRGHLFDIFSPFDPLPYRIEYFGDEIVSIRTYDPESQRSLEEKTEIRILPCRELILSDANFEKAKLKIKDLGDSLEIDRSDRERMIEDLRMHREIVEPRWLLPAFASERVTLLEYLPQSISDLILVDEEDGDRDWSEAVALEEKAYQNLNRLAYKPSELRDPLSGLQNFLKHSLQTLIGTKGFAYQCLGFDFLRNRLMQAKSFSPLLQVLTEHREKGIPIEFVFQSRKRMLSLQDSLAIEGNTTWVTWAEGPLFSGFSSSTFQKAFITEQDIFGSRRKKSSVASKSPEEFLRQFSDLKEGDYIVHEDHGVGRYRGLQTLDLHGAKSEFLLLEYAEQDKLYLPIYRVDKIARYVSDGAAHPRLDRLGSLAFARRKTKARKDILAIAHELLEIAASRKLVKMDRKLDIDRKTYDQFCHNFLFELTPDQEKASLDIERDLQETYPMDRLVCGDVGFGKTEVAMRAAMLSVLNTKQVVVLAPTTILVEQHFRNFQKRFEGFPVRIQRLSRFVNDKEQKTILQAAKEDQVDILIGTHRLLQPDVKIHNLGLLIVDEEQRFGVRHKERIKKMKASTDILTLSATPIPRTLQMAIFGIRELSLITTPPENREAVRTFVGTHEEPLIRNAVMKELGRGGQVLFVHNRVKTIDSVADRLKKIVPEAKMVIVHGQMKEDELEKHMLDFMENKANILIATSIIENGLDIPNANTLLVDHAEMFGLSDLYQLRGRVGRSYRSAYAYFLIHENTELSQEASKRLQVIQTCTALGSGFNVATHDMEIRGAGNLLGEAQSGVVAEVGLELYTQMLQDTLQEIKKENPVEPLVELNSGYSAYLPETYVPDASVRIATYKRLNRVRSSQELLDLEEELLDRFGLYPREVEALCQVLRLRVMVQDLKVQTMDLFPGRLSLLFRPETPLSPEKVLPLLSKNLSLDPKGRLSFSFHSALKKKDIHLEVKHQHAPELHDFEVCRRFLRDLREKAGLSSEAF